MEETHFSQAGSEWQLNYILWICLQSVKMVLWRLHDCSPREVLTYMFSPDPFQQEANAYMQLEPNTWCTHATSNSFACILSLSLSRGRILARGCLFHLHVAMLYVLSSRVEFFSVMLKFILVCLEQVNQAGAMDQRWTFSHRKQGNVGILPARVRSFFLRSALHILALKMLNFSTFTWSKIKDKSQYWFLRWLSGK